MLHSRTLNNKINRIHERASRTVCSDVQSLAIEIYKYLHGLSPAILTEVFKINKKIPYDLRMRNELYARNPKTVRHGTETIFLMSPKIWYLIPQDIKDSGSLPCFKKNIRKWKPNCPCRLCKTFLQHVDFI